MVIKLENTTSHQTYEYEVVDANNGEKLYFRFDINTSDLVEGEYKLELVDNGEIIATDILKIGDYNPNTIQYKKGENTYINVTLDPNIQERKKVEITAPKTVISPDAGFHSIAQVEVDAENLYNTAYEEGNVVGFNNGKRKQKELLEQITITQNGVYNREDGYNEVIVEVPDVNGSYDDGYYDGYDVGKEDGISNAGEIIAETAQVLNITENGTYTSQYSQYNDYTKPKQITGDFGDGKYFYNWANYDSYYDTEIKPTIDKRLEFWIKDNKPTEYTNIIFIGTDALENSDFYFGKSYTKQQYVAKIGNSTVYFNQTDIWLHIIMSIADGLIVNGEKIGDFETINVNYYSNFGIGRQGGGTSPTIGMVKIDDQIIIPTDNGLLNITTGNYIPKRNETINYNYTYINNFTEPIAEGNLIRTVNVNVIPKINIQNAGIKFAYSPFSEVPEWADWTDIKDMNYMFYQCSKLTSVPELDTSKATSMKYMFSYCGSLTSIPLLLTSNVTNISDMFYNCQNLTTIPELDTSNVTDINRMLGSCIKLTSLPPLNVSKVTSNGPFGSSDMPNITDVGGFIGLKYSWNNNNYGINKLPNLTYQSCINILNGLYDFTGNGETPKSTEGKLKVHQNFLNLVGDEISIGTNKGWIITA